MTTVEGDAKVIQVDYSNEGSIQHALSGADVVISTIPSQVIDIQGKIAAAAKNTGVKLFVPSEFGGISEGETEWIFGAKANVQSQLKALDMPFTAFYTGLFADYGWIPCVSRFTSVCFVWLTTGSKVPGPRRQERESVHWWRRQQAVRVHLQNGYCPICFLCLNTPSCRTTEEPCLHHRWGREGNV